MSDDSNHSALNFRSLMAAWGGDPNTDGDSNRLSDADEARAERLAPAVATVLDELQGNLMIQALAAKRREWRRILSDEGYSITDIQMVWETALECAMDKLK